jgi:Ni/Fe-hydrogenase subunit HybB-like protein
VLGLVVHRTGVAIVGLDVPEYPRYVPHVAEILITVGIVSLGLLAFRLAVAVLPVYETHAVLTSSDVPAAPPLQHRELAPVHSA